MTRKNETVKKRKDSVNIKDEIRHKESWSHAKEHRSADSCQNRILAAEEWGQKSWLIAKCHQLKWRVRTILFIYLLFQKPMQRCVDSLS